MNRIFVFIFTTIISFGCAYNSLDERVDCSTSDLSIQASEVQDTDCGSSSGSIQGAASGGTSPYQYALNTGPLQSDNTFGNLAAGNYFLITVDASSCSDTTSVTVGNKEGVEATSQTIASGCSTSNGSITVSATEGDEPYTYKFEGGQEQNQNVFTGLIHGNYSITVTDANGCTFTLDETVLSGVSFAQSISPIIANNCAISGCHAGSQSPDFRVFANIQNNAQGIKTRTQNGSMPKGGSLTQEEIDLIACWVDDGAPEN